MGIDSPDGHTRWLDYHRVGMEYSHQAQVSGLSQWQSEPLRGLCALLWHIPFHGLTFGALPDIFRSGLPLVTTAETLHRNQDELHDSSRFDALGCIVRRSGTPGRFRAI